MLFNGKAACVSCAYRSWSLVAAVSSQFPPFIHSFLPFTHSWFCSNNTTTEGPGEGRRDQQWNSKMSCIRLLRYVDKPQYNDSLIYCSFNLSTMTTLSPCNKLSGSGFTISAWITDGAQRCNYIRPSAPPWKCHSSIIICPPGFCRKPLSAPSL